MTVKEGVARIATGSLAGSTLTMDRAVQNAMAAADLSLAEAWQMASYNPAQVIGLEKKGSLEPGEDADIVLLDDELKVVLTMVGGLSGKRMYELVDVVMTIRFPLAMPS